MIGVLWILLPLLGVSLGWIGTHLRPLRSEEVDSLAEKRRRRTVGRYFRCMRHEVPVDKGFKKRMDPKGRMY